MKCILPLNQLFYSIVLLVFLKNNATAQGPIQPTGLIGQKEIVMVWDEGSSNSQATINNQVANLILGFAAQPQDQRLNFNTRKTENDGSYGDRQLDVASGDFDGDGINEYVVASRAPGNQIRLRIPHLSKTTLTYTTSETVLVGSNVSDQSDIRVLAGNFDSDNQDEIVLAYKSTDNKLHIEYYDTNGTLIPVLKAHIEDETLVSNTSPNDWGIAVHDLDGDNKDEIIIGFRPATPGQGVFAKVYKVDSITIVPKARKLIDNASLTSKTNAVTIAVSAGDYNKDGKPELALAWGRMDSCGGTGCGDSFLYPLKIGDDNSTVTKDSLEVITFNAANRAIVSLSPNSLSALNLQSGDLNADGRDEIVLAGAQGAEIFEADNNLKLTNKSMGGYSSGTVGYATDFLRVGDIDGKPGDEVITMSHFFDSDPSGQQTFSLSILSFDTNLNAAGVAVKNNFLSVPTNGSENTHRHYAMATGDFNGDNFKIGEGTKYIKTGIMQPIVILNAPPTHFDVLNNKTYDVNSCYNTNLANCSQKATYYKSTSETQMINTEIHSDWGVSSTLSGEASYLGVSVKAHLTATYGEKFSNTQNSSQTVNVSTQIAASGDDLIYATVCDYEVWEYPVITASNTRSGYILAVIPKLTENRWFPSKERSADGYIPKHEVGNILSYTPYADLKNPDQLQMLQGSYLQGSTDLNESTDATFEVNLNNTFSNTTTRQRDIGLEVGGSVGGWGVELSGTATYNQSEISTHTTTVESSVDAKVHLGPIDRSLGEDNFNVTPYVYWANNGALVIDYAARAILPSAGGTATWWSDNYGKQQDPAFILPWRLDPEKGLALQDDARRQQTKSISFEPKEPKVGDTVTITALINNFSLKQTQDSVPVSFYIGDPNSGGTLLTSIDGKTLFKTPGIIPAQGFMKVSMKWKRPATSNAFPRIYAYIDPQNKMTEIHENNNIGWTVLGNSSSSGTATSILPITETQPQNLTDSYPNPFNSSVTIDYVVPENGKVSLILYNLQGQALRVLINEQKEKGQYLYDLHDENLPNGVYFYSYKTGNKQVVKKIIKISK